MTIYVYASHSMEGSVAKLHKIVELKKKYKVSLENTYVHVPYHACTKIGFKVMNFITTKRVCQNNGSNIRTLYMYICSYSICMCVVTLNLLICTMYIYRRKSLLSNEVGN